MITPFSISNHNSKTFANSSQAIGQFINSSDITHQTGCQLVLLSCSPFAHPFTPLSRSANGYWSLVVTVIYSGPLSGHKTSPADDNSPGRLYSCHCLMLDCWDFCSLCCYCIIYVPSRPQPCGQGVLIVFSIKHVAIYLFFLRLCFIFLAWTFFSQAPGIKETRVGVPFCTLSMESRVFLLQLIRSLSENSKRDEVSREAWKQF